MLPASPDAHDEAIESVLHERARVLLARVVVTSASLPVTGLTAERVQVNNMLRPFAHAAGQLVALMRQGG